MYQISYAYWLIYTCYWFCHYPSANHCSINCSPIQKSKNPPHCPKPQSPTINPKYPKRPIPRPPFSPYPHTRSLHHFHSPSFNPPNPSSPHFLLPKPPTPKSPTFPNPLISNSTVSFSLNFLSPNSLIPQSRICKSPITVYLYSATPIQHILKSPISRVLAFLV